MFRPIKIIGKSYDKFGERIKKLLDVDITQGLSCVSVKGTKLILMVDDYQNERTRIIHYDIVNDRITLDQQLDRLVWYYDARVFRITNNLSFVDGYGIFYKYNPTTNSYEIIDLGIGGIYESVIANDKILSIRWDNCRVYDLNGNLLTTFPFGAEYLSYYEPENKAYVWFAGRNTIYEIDLTNLTYREIALPSNFYIRYGYPVKRIPNTNKLLIFIYNWNTNVDELYELDLNTLQLSLKKQFPELEYVDASFISDNCKIVFITVWDAITTNYLETFVYDVERDVLKLAFSTDYVFLIVGDDNVQRYLIKDAPYGYVVYIYDYRKDKILGVIKNYGWYDIRIDGKIWLTI